MKVTIDRSGCLGCGLCAGVCPEVFRMADDDLAEVWAEPTAKEEDKVREAASGCPAAVIQIEEE